MRELEAFVYLLPGARRLTSVGMRGADALAQQFGYSLNMLRTGVSVLAGESDKIADMLIDLGPEDVLVGFAFSRQSRHTVRYWP